MKNSNSILIKVISFYDTVTHESATNGDYEQTGCDYKELNFYGYRSLNDSVNEFISLYKNNFWDSGEVEVGQILYACDPDTDYQTGEESYDRICISVDDTSDSNIRDRVIRALNYLIQKRI